MIRKTMSIFDWLRRRAPALLALSALVVMWTAVLLVMRAEPHSPHLAAMPNSDEMTEIAGHLPAAQPVSSSADIAPVSDSDYRADRAYFRALVPDSASDYQADRAYFHALGVEMSTIRTTAASPMPANSSR